MSIMSAATDHAFSLDPDRAYGLPRSYYLDEEIFRRELEEIFLTTWQFVGAVQELPEPGSYFSAAVVDQPLFVIRGKDGKIRAFHNVCPHRGHELVTGSGRKTIVTCPYHAWSFDTEGALKAAGNSENVLGFDAADFALREIRTELFANLVYVNFDDGAAPLGEVMKGLDEEFHRVIPGFDELVLFRRDPVDIQANWKIVVENFVECYHCPQVHPGIMGEDNANMDLSFESTDEPYWSRHIIRSHSEQKQAASDRELPYDYRRNPPIRDAWLWSSWPNTCFIARPGDPNFQVFHVMPVAPGVTHETLVNFAASDPPEEPELKVFDVFRDHLNWQDIGVVESVQRGMRSLGYRPGRLMVDGARSWRSEASVHHFDSLVWRALNGSDGG